MLRKVGEKRAVGDCSTLFMLYTGYCAMTNYVSNEGLQSLLASTAVSLPPHELDACPHDYFRGCGRGTMSEIVTVCVNPESFVLHVSSLLFFTPVITAHNDIILLTLALEYRHKR